MLCETLSFAAAVTRYPCQQRKHVQGAAELTTEPASSTTGKPVILLETSSSNAACQVMPQHEDLIEDLPMSLSIQAQQTFIYAGVCMTGNDPLLCHQVLNSLIGTLLQGTLNISFLYFGFSTQLSLL